MYIYRNGQDRRDPVKCRLHEIEKQEVQKPSLRKAQNITVREAVGRWLRGPGFDREGWEFIR